MLLAWVAAAAVLAGFALLEGSGLHAGRTAAVHPLPAMVLPPVTVPSVSASPSRSARPAAVPVRHRHPRRATAVKRTLTVPRPSVSPQAGGAPVQVTYSVTSVAGPVFHGELEVVNHTGQPLAGWQIVIALNGDNVTAIHGAAGYASNGILLLHPTTANPVVPPNGGILRVSFTASGPQQTPLACDFNSITCQSA
jgi:hypothetical protein